MERSSLKEDCIILWAWDLKYLNKKLLKTSEVAEV